MKIKDARTLLGLTQAEMAKKMGMAQSSLARIEAGARKETKGQMAHLETLMAAKEILDCYYDPEDGVSLIPYLGRKDAEVKASWEKIKKRVAT